ncbi:MAG: fibronectin type III domain-containing protein, partial [Clostridia bacterium]|nr:fibronectin type III domain-containing protein [Clostridia bacterium]
SIDALCKTIDNYRAVIELALKLASLPLIGDVIDLGDLESLDLSQFLSNLSRKGSGDVVILREFLELAASNSNIIGKLIDGSLNLGVLGNGLNLDLKLSETIRVGVVDALFKDSPDYEKAKADALSDFDKFIYEDVIGLITKPGSALEGLEVNEGTTVNNFIAQVYNLIAEKYVVDFIKNNPFSFGNLDGKYAGLDGIFNFTDIDGLKACKFDVNKPVLEQVNNVFGSVFGIIVPEYTGWVASEDYKVLSENMRDLVQYIAGTSGLVESVEVAEKMDDAVLIYEIIKAFTETGNDEFKGYVSSAKNLEELVNAIFRYLGKDTYAYTANHTYEHVLGDWAIKLLEDSVPLYDKNGKTITVGSGTGIWDVLNSFFNFFFVDKNMDAFYGWEMTKESSYFDKLDMIIALIYDKGATKTIKSKELTDNIIDSLFTVNLEKFIENTAVEILTETGTETVVGVLYKMFYNVIDNLSVSSTPLKKYTEDYFDKAISDEGIANIVKVVIESISQRTEGVACVLAVVYGLLDKVVEDISEKDATCTAAGYKYTKTCPKCGYKVINGATIPAKGHKETVISTKAATCTADGNKIHQCTVCKVKRTEVLKKYGHKWGKNSITKQATCYATGVRTYYCTNSGCKATKTETIAKTKHKETGYKTTKAATYKTTGTAVNKCSVKACNATLGTKTLNYLTLAKPTGLKFTAVSTTSIKFSWSKVKGAEEYILYYKTGSGKWKTVTVKKGKTSYTVKKLKTGTTYKFKVVAVAGKNKSKASSEASASTMLATASLKRAQSKKAKEVVVEWKKISGVTGYEVQYSTSNKFTKKTTKTVTVKKDKTVKTFLKKLKSKKTYYVKVRAYKTIGKTKVYGNYSKVIKVKCK